MPLLTTFYDDDNHGNNVSFIAFWLCMCIASGGYCGVNGLCDRFSPVGFENAELASDSKENEGF